MSRLNKYRNSRKSRRQNMRGGADPVEPDTVVPDDAEVVPMDYEQGEGNGGVSMDANDNPPQVKNFQGDPGPTPPKSPPKSSESLTYVDLNNSGDPNNPVMGGGSPRKPRRNKRRKSRKNKTLKGGCSPLGSAILPFGLLGFQKYVQSYASRRNSYRKRSKKMRSRRSRNQSNQ